MSALDFISTSLNYGYRLVVLYGVPGLLKGAKNFLRIKGGGDILEKKRGEDIFDEKGVRHFPDKYFPKFQPIYPLTFFNVVYISFWPVYT